MAKNFIQATPEMKALLVKCGSSNKQEALAAQAELAIALTPVLRQGVLFGDIVSDIFEVTMLDQGVTPEYPLDFIAPGTEKDFVAYTMPSHGTIPQRRVEGDYVVVPTYGVAASIDWLLKYARDARWNIVSRGMEVMQSQFTKKKNDDAWHTLIAAGVDRNIVVLDADANPGQFTKRLVSLGKTVMRRNGGGNTTSVGGGVLTDMYMSTEATEDIRNWGIDQVDELTRREIFVAGDGRLNRIFGVNIHELFEFGEGQEYNLFYLNDMAASLPSGDVEIMVGLDQRASDSFVMPVREDVQIFEDDTVHRQGLVSYYGRAEWGLAALDNRRVILLSV